MVNAWVSTLAAKDHDSSSSATGSGCGDNGQEVGGEEDKNGDLDADKKGDAHVEGGASRSFTTLFIDGISKSVVYFR